MTFYTLIQDPQAFLWMPFVGGLLLALLSGPFGALLVWKRLAYSADAFAHAGLLGGVLGTLFSLTTLVTALSFSFSSAILMYFLLRYFRNREETLLLLGSTMAMCMGLWVMDTYGISKAQVFSFLAGNPQHMPAQLFYSIAALTAAGSLFLLFASRALFSWILYSDLARIEGLQTNLLQFTFLLIVFLLILFGIQWSGALLLSILFICPLLIVQPWAHTPFQILFASSFFSALSYSISFLLWNPTQESFGPILGLVMISCILVSRALFWLKNKKFQSFKESTALP